MSFPDRVTRHARIKQPNNYLKKDVTLESERTIPPEELPFEFMLNALRLVEGFPLTLFRERTGLPLQLVERELGEAEAQGLLERDWQRIRPSERGRLFLNQLLEHFLPEKKGAPL